MTVDHIYTIIGQNVVNNIPEDVNWSKAELKIEAYLNNYIEYKGKYFTSEAREFNLDVEGFKHREMKSSIYELLTIMTEGSDKNKWNRAVFKLTPDGKFDMKFTWDQELDDKIKNA